MHTFTRTIRLLATFVSLLVGLALSSEAPVSVIPEPLFAAPISVTNLPRQVASGDRGTSPLAPGALGEEKRTVDFIPNGVNGQVYALAVQGSNIYVGGKFNMAGDTPAPNVAKWDGKNWSALSNGLDGPVYALAWGRDNVLYAGGNFSRVCSSADCSSVGVQANHVAAWNGSTWSPLGNGVDGDVYALVLDTSSNLYIGGNFTSICAAPDCATGTSANNIARWNQDSKTWLQLVTEVAPNGVNATVRALAWESAPRNLLYVGGDFTAAGNVTANRVVRWDPSARSWASFNYGLSGLVRALDWDGTRRYLYAGGDFVSACGDPTCGSPIMLNYIARWDGTTWSALEDGVNGPVYALAQDSRHDLYAGGDFSGAGNTAVNRVAKWSWFAISGSWSALGGGSDSRVTALAVGGGSTYAAGAFSVGKDAMAAGIGKWTSRTDTGSWSALAPTPAPAPDAAMPFALNILTVSVLAVLALALLVGVRVFGSRAFATPHWVAFAVLGLAFLIGVAALTTGLFSIQSPAPAAAPDSQARAVPKTMVSTATPSMGLPVPTTTPSLAGAATLRPVSTASPTGAGNSPTPTMITATSMPPPVTDNPIPTNGGSPTIAATASLTSQPPVALRYPAVPLREPQHDQKVQGESLTLEWQDIGLAESDHYELWLRRFGGETWDKRFKVSGGKFVLLIRDGMDYGDYIWSIFILDAHQQVVSHVGEERKVTWQPRGAREPSAPGAPQPPIITK